MLTANATNVVVGPFGTRMHRMCHAIVALLLVLHYEFASAITVSLSGRGRVDVAILRSCSKVGEVMNDRRHLDCLAVSASMRGGLHWLWLWLSGWQL